jgi:hypothetical protein
MFRGRIEKFSQLQYVSVRYKTASTNMENVAKLSYHVIIYRSTLLDRNICNVSYISAISGFSIIEILQIIVVWLVIPYRLVDVYNYSK